MFTSAVALNPFMRDVCERRIKAAMALRSIYDTSVELFSDLIKVHERNKFASLPQHFNIVIDHEVIYSGSFRTIASSPETLRFNKMFISSPLKVLAEAGLPLSIGTILEIESKRIKHITSNEGGFSFYTNTSSKSHYSLSLRIDSRIAGNFLPAAVVNFDSTSNPRYKYHITEVNSALINNLAVYTYGNDMTKVKEICANNGVNFDNPEEDDIEFINLIIDANT